jgi:EAL domain-containing protein (putative c-di-GMP-specific phosphodiesterase class I)
MVAWRRASCLGPRSEVEEPWAVLAELLTVLRRRLRMDLSWLARREGDLLVLQVASGDTAGFGVDIGASVRWEDSLYAKVLSGELPSLLPDVRADPHASQVPVVDEIGIGSYAATPVLDSEGRVYGILGCVAHEPCLSLRPSDGGFLRLLAAFLTEFVIDLQRLWDTRSATWRRLRDLIDQGGPRMFFQPVIELATGQTVAVEALARFPEGSSPHDLFAAAGSVGLGLELEMAAVRNALRALADMPPNVLLAVNASPATVTGGAVDLIVGTGTPERVTVEITEHEYVGHDHDLLLATEVLRGHGTHIAVDDVGSCYSGLEQLLHLRPEVIKIDSFIIHGIDTDPARRAVAVGLITVATEIGARVVAEGIESISEMNAVVDAGICYGQGFLLGPPAADITEACSAGTVLSAPTIGAQAHVRTTPRGPRL